MPTRPDVNQLDALPGDAGAVIQGVVGRVVVSLVVKDENHWLTAEEQQRNGPTVSVMERPEKLVPFHVTGDRRPEERSRRTDVDADRAKFIRQRDLRVRCRR